ncbi:MAG: hypothetical protein L6R38_002735 [Xanthoria sp. 2 TBL-2021]|nr:MAG: hypothetical protein L6R38_002735 [Xanthoria sp. 2 TBL-2021]
MEEFYSSAIALLNSRRRKARPGLVGPPGGSNILGLDSMPSLNGTPSLKGTPSLMGVREWLQELGHSDDDVDRLNVIHVSGTKGKGSTCAFINSFLKAHGERTGFPRKIGLYTSPHLKFVQERIQIDSRPISEILFAKYVFEVWHGLSGKISPGPRYLQLLLLISVHAFIREGVDVAIYETHNGGEYDATNVIQKPVVTGVTTIGMDHVEQLGPLIENIAWHKAGIFKHGSPAFSTFQEPAAATVLQQRANEKNVALQFIGVNPTLPHNALALKPEVQRTNCSLAIALASTFLKVKAPQDYCILASQDILQGIEQFSWPGRFHHIVDGNHQWFLDGAHNELSIQKAAQWFVETTLERQGYLVMSDPNNVELEADVSSTSPPCTRVLIFSHISERDGAALLKGVAETLHRGGLQIQHVILSTYEERQDGAVSMDPCSKTPEQPFSLDLQKDYIEAYRSIDPDARISIEPTIEGALNLAREIGSRDNGMQTLVTGSLYLIGGALRLLEKNTEEMPYNIST